MARDDYRLALGHVSPTAILADTASVIENWTRSTDMPSIMDWYDPTAESDIYTPYTELVDSLDGSRGANGDGEVTWTFPLLMPGQIEWVWINKWQRAYSGLFTLQTPDLTILNGWRVIWCTGLWFDPRKDAKKIGNALSEVKISFINCKTRPYDSMFTTEFTTEFK